MHDLTSNRGHHAESYCNIVNSTKDTQTGLRRHCFSLEERGRELSRGALEGKRRGEGVLTSYPLSLPLLLLFYIVAAAAAVLLHSLLPPMLLLLSS